MNRFSNMFSFKLTLSFLLIIVDLFFVAFMVHPTAVGLAVVLLHVSLIFLIRWVARREGRAG